MQQGKLPTSRVRIYLSTPTHDERIHMGLVSQINHARKIAFADIVVHELRSSSALAYNFNCAWASFCEHFERGEVDRFVLVHQDIIPLDTVFGANKTRSWLDGLIQIQDQLGVTCLSAVSPIKDFNGLTSCGIDTNEWSPQRFTIHQIEQDGWTHLTNAECIAKYGYPLLVNTGLMIIRPRPNSDWYKSFFFTFNDRVVLDSKGRRVAQMQPEDWQMSRSLHACNEPYAVTRAAPLMHVGVHKYTNWQDGKYSFLEVDPVYGDTANNGN